MLVDFSTLAPTQVYHLMTQSIVPRPVAWILTENETSEPEHQYNLAPFSYFNAVASSPPTLMISIGVQADKSSKDTLKNIERTNTLVIHIASAERLSALNMSSASLPYGVSELRANSLATRNFDGFPLPRLSSAKIAFGCELDHTHLIGDSPQTLVFAQIKAAYFDDKLIYRDEKNRLKLNAEKLDPVARLGGNEYALLGDIISKQRPA